MSDALDELKKQIEEARLSLTQPEFIVFLLSISAVRPDETRIVYTILREVFLERALEFFQNALKFDAEWAQRTMASRERFEEIQGWLRPPQKPLTLERGLQLIKDSKSKDWSRAVLKRIGKHPRRGQPTSKKHLAVPALDMKFLHSPLTLRQATDALCPCGHPIGKHSDQCREQLRQQINRLVKFLRTLGYDFTWERIGLVGVELINEESSTL